MTRADENRPVAEAGDVRRVSKREMFCLSAYWAGHAFLWNGLHPIVLPAILIGSDGRPSARTRGS